MPERELVTVNAYDKPYLTTEKGKMYNLYVVNLDGSVELFEDEKVFDSWRDHCIEPVAFHNLALSNGLSYDDETMAHVCEEFVCNHLGSEWGRLHEFLPKK